jgi:hypothetical protein
MTIGPRGVVLLLFLLLGLLLGLAACTPASPASPSFASDVGPILAAHCARCHGPWGDGGAQITDYTTPGRTQKICYLDAYEDRGDCGDRDAALTGLPCQRGAHTCADLIVAAIATMPPPPYPMPPPPSAPLNDWELDVVRRWAAKPLP